MASEVDALARDLFYARRAVYSQASSRKNSDVRLKQMRPLKAEIPKRKVETKQQTIDL